MAWNYSENDFKRCKASQWQGDKKRCRWCNKQLRKRQRKWCSKDCYYKMGSNHTWTYARRAAKKRDGYRCKACKSARHLEVNHKKPILGKHATPGCHHHLVGLETLCHDCHLKVTAVQREQGLLKSRKFKGS